MESGQLVPLVSCESFSFYAPAWICISVCICICVFIYKPHPLTVNSSCRVSDDISSGVPIRVRVAKSSVYIPNGQI